jgi:hypothetical protein
VTFVGRARVHRRGRTAAATWRSLGRRRLRRAKAMLGNALEPSRTAIGHVNPSRAWQPERIPWRRGDSDTGWRVSSPLLHDDLFAMLRVPQNAPWERDTVLVGRAGRLRIFAASGVCGILENTPLTPSCTPVYSCGLPQKAALECAF